MCQDISRITNSSMSSSSLMLHLVGVGGGTSTLGTRHHSNGWNTRCYVGGISTTGSGHRNTPYRIAPASGGPQRR